MCPFDTIQQFSKMKTFLLHSTMWMNQGVKHPTTGWYPQYHSPALAGSISLGRRENSEKYQGSTEDLSDKEQFIDDMEITQLFVNQCSLTHVPGPHLLNTRTTKCQWFHFYVTHIKHVQLSKILFRDTNTRVIKKNLGKRHRDIWEMVSSGKWRWDGMGWRSGLLLLFFSKGQGSTECWHYWALAILFFFRCNLQMYHLSILWFVVSVFFTINLRESYKEKLNRWERWSSHLLGKMIPHVVTGKSLALPHHSRNTLARVPLSRI